MFNRAYNNFKMLYRIYRTEANFVLSEQRKTCNTNPSNGNAGYLINNVLSDITIELTGFCPKQDYSKPMRLVRYWDEEQNLEFVFLTNAFQIPAFQVAELYKNRWQVEMFFKWLKQHLKIKKFWGTTENAVRIQIYAAISTYCW